MKRLVRGLLGTVIFFGLLGGVFWYASNLFTPVSDSSKPIKVDIPLGASAGTIADRLKAAGLIRNALAFTLMARVMGDSENMKAGEYKIAPNKGVLEIIDQLVSGTAEFQWVVIPEGKTIQQIATILNEQRLADANSFVSLAARKPKRLGLDVPVSRRSVEGYLMPDSYKLPRKSSPKLIIQEMLKNWNAKVLRPNKALFAKSDLPLDKVIIVASMIEREARTPEDRPRISSVIRNRLKKKMRLEIDATVIYALGKPRNKVSYADLKVDSPYNTYRIPALPPGPICNPGLASVEAALRPEKTPYLFYVAQPDGSHLFATTFGDHQRNIVRVRGMRAGGSGGAAGG